MTPGASASEPPEREPTGAPGGPSPDRWPIGGPIRFAASVFVTVLIVHAANYVLHEYAHAFTAWALGWKADPLALDYGTARIDNVLLQQQIDENVDYGPIFAAHAGWQAALIAAAGPLFANGGVALLCHPLIASVLRRDGGGPARSAVLWWLVWLDAFATFNVWSYAPLRTLATHADMALLAQGLGISVWLLFPFACAFGGWLVYRFARIVLPQADLALRGRLPPDALRTTCLAVSLGFFSTGGLDGHYGPYVAIADMVSLFFVLPLLLTPATGRTPPGPTAAGGPKSSPSPR